MKHTYDFIYEKKAIVITTTLSSELGKWLTEKSKELKITKREILESALEKYRYELRKEQMAVSFREAAMDPEIIAMAEDGMDDYLDQLKKIRVMKQKDIFLAQLNPTLGREQQGTRPVVIISGNTMNDNLGLVIVCPLSSKIKNYISSTIVQKNELNNLSLESEILPFQVRTLDKKRLLQKIGSITDEELQDIIFKLQEILKY